VLRKVPLSSRMIRVTFTGDELAGLEVTEPAASVRLLLPSTAGEGLVMPQWNGNEFLLDDGSRPVIRTFTPRRLHREQLELDIDMVMHEGGAAAEWAAGAEPGDPAAVSGTGRGYQPDPGAAEFVLGGDESAIPAISQLLENLPASIPVQVHIEIADLGARMALPAHPRAAIEWHEPAPGGAIGDALVGAIIAAEFGSEAHIWCAGEAATMHRIRTHLFKERGLPRSQCTVRGYWKVAREGSE
jgi:NADPH-dependent ferric siderophore reductase